MIPEPIQFAKMVYYQFALWLQLTPTGPNPYRSIGLDTKTKSVIDHELIIHPTEMVEK
jgi:hypothetical protein